MEHNCFYKIYKINNHKSACQDCENLLHQSDNLLLDLMFNIFNFDINKFSAYTSICIYKLLISQSKMQRLFQELDKVNIYNLYEEGKLKKFLSDLEIELVFEDLMRYPNGLKLIEFLHNKDGLVELYKRIKLKVFE